MKLLNLFIITAGLTCLSGYKGRSQTSPDFFSQKATMQKYMLEQIALYRFSSLLLKNGYTTVTNGINKVTDSKSASLRANSNYFNSLLRPANAIGRLPQVNNIFAYADATEKIIAGLYKEAGNFPASRLSALAHRASLNRATTRRLVNGDGTQMTDDERIDRINECLATAIRQFSAARALAQAITQIKDHRAKQRTNIETVRQLYRLP